MKKRICTLLLALALLCGLLPWSAMEARAAATSGACGDNVTWTLDPSTGTLTIRGTGDMTDFDSRYNRPWYDYTETIQKVVLQKGVTGIGDYAFLDFSKLTEITIPDSVTRIGNGSLAWCSRLRSISIPNSVVTIASGAFNGCGLRSVTIPDSVTTIGESAFLSCTNLTGAVLPKRLTVIVDGMFEQCWKLTDITLPDTVKEIGENAFCECERLTAITIPDRVTSIGAYAFSGCKSLETITIPDRVKSIGHLAFSCCTGLAGITVSPGNPYYCNDSFGALYDRNHTKLFFVPTSVVGSYTIRSGVQTIMDEAFRGCLELTDVTIPDSVTSIGESAFANCKGLTVLEIPFSVVSIEDNACWGCSDDLLICGYYGTEAEAFADRNDYSFDGQEMEPPVIRTHPKNASGALGDTVRFQVKADGDLLKYQWQYSKDQGRHWHTWTGKTSAALEVKISETNNGCLYRCVVKNPGGSVTSNTAKLTNDTPYFTADPVSRKANLGELVTFEVQAEGKNLTYQWQYSRDNGGTWRDWSGKTAPVFTVQASKTNNGCLYRCAVSNQTKTAFSHSARLTVRNAPPLIVVQPKHSTVALGKTVTLKTVAGGSNLCYQWYFSRDNGQHWNAWAGKTDYKLTITGSATNNGCCYRCVVRNAYGKVYSVTARLTVN